MIVMYTSSPFYSLCTLPQPLERTKIKNKVTELQKLALQAIIIIVIIYNILKIIALCEVVLSPLHTYIISFNSHTNLMW